MRMRQVRQAARAGHPKPRAWLIALFAAGLLGTAPLEGKAQAPGATWTKGHRKVLVIPVRFTDAQGPTDSDVRGITGWTPFTNGVATAAISNFFVAQSYGQFSVDFTVLPVIDLGVPTSYYTNICPGTPHPKWTVWGAPGSLADDARARARAVGLTNDMAALYDSANYDLDVIATGYIPGQAGAASDGARSVIAFNYFTAIAHELCHCLGLQHANGISRATYYSPVSNSASPFFYDAYGDVYCLMGWKENTRTASPPPDRHANPYFKYELGWLTTNNIATPTTSGTYRIYAFDSDSLDPGKDYAARIARDPSHTYWLSLRGAITNPPDSKWSQGGLEVRFGAESPRASSGATVLWDMTPGSRGPTGVTFATMHDAPLQAGRTYTDAEADIHITPVRKGGTAPESLDVTVCFGPFPDNHPPTLSLSPASTTLAAGVEQVFTATAFDADGDPLAYYWEYDDPTKSGGTDFGGMNADSRLATQGKHSWTQPGVSFVRCTVSDMKGHTLTASATVSVTNGSPAPVTISGTVRDEFGGPLAGALVNNFKSGAAYGSTSFVGSSETAADGRYQIVLARTNTRHILSAMHQGYSFACSLPGGTVTVAAASVTNVNFTRVRARRSLSGGVYVAGHGYSSATYGSLWVSDGTQSVLVSNGTWQLSVDDGALVTLTATATNPAYTISSDFPKPYRVANDVGTLSFFVDVPGAMPRGGFAYAGTNTDDRVGTVHVPVTLALPPGVTNWGGDQVFSLRIDPASTASYGVDYTMSEALITFYGALPPSPRLIPISIIHDGVPKTRTLILRLEPGSSVASLGTNITFVCTITNPRMPPAKTRIAGASIADGAVSLSITNVTAGATNHVLRCGDLAFPLWSTAGTFTGVSGQMPWTEGISNTTGPTFYRVISE